MGDREVGMSLRWNKAAWDITIMGDAALRVAMATGVLE